MTEQKSFKRLVRARMEKTGERYTAARAALLAANAPKATDGPALAVSDAVMVERTGRGWEEWFDALDAWGAADRPATEIRRWVAEEHGVGSWGSQAVAIGFTRARGLRAVGEGPDGFAITVSRTVTAPVERLFAAFADPPIRETWLPGATLRERTSTPPKSVRFDWNGGATRIHAFFEAKDETRSTLWVAHERIPDGEQAEALKAFWRERVNALKEMMEA